MSVSPLSAFTAVPNPQMLAFMGAQSFVMMYQAGEGWQYGKRRISAMSNEEFNKLTPQIVMEKQAVVLRSSLATIERSMNDMTPMIGTIVKQYGDFIREIIAAIPEAFQNALGQNESRQFSARPGTPAFITPIIPYIGTPGNAGGSSFIAPVAPPTPSSRIISISQLRSMSLADLLALRSQGGLSQQSMLHLFTVLNEKAAETRTRNAPPAPTRSITSNEILIRDYFAKKAEMFSKIIKLQEAMVRSKQKFTVMSGTEGQRARTAWESQRRTHTRLKADWYRFMQNNRNSRVQQIKVDATQSYQSRPFT